MIAGYRFFEGQVSSLTMFEQGYQDEYTINRGAPSVVSCWWVQVVHCGSFD